MRVILAVLLLVGSGSSVSAAVRDPEIAKQEQELLQVCIDAEKARLEKLNGASADASERERAQARQQQLLARQQELSSAIRVPAQNGDRDGDEPRPKPKPKPKPKPAVRPVAQTRDAQYQDWIRRMNTRTPPPTQQPRVYRPTYQPQPQPHVDSGNSRTLDKINKGLGILQGLGVFRRR